jgi:RNA polymerase sigma-70 factor (ECF subfamily)
MPEENTTAIVQRCLNALAKEAPAEPIIRALLNRAVRRLQHLCASLRSGEVARQEMRK